MDNYGLLRVLLVETETVKMLRKEVHKPLLIAHFLARTFGKVGYGREKEMGKIL